jgi:hypothetical protein
MALGSKRQAVVVAVTTVMAGVTAVAAASVPPPASSKFKGLTSQTKAKDHRVTLRTDANGRVKQLTLGWLAPCTEKGKSWRAHTQVDGGTAGLPQSGNTFHRSGSYVGETDDPAITGKVTVSFKGHFTDKNHAKGTWNAKVSVQQDGETIDKCKTPTIKWKVHRVK